MSKVIVYSTVDSDVVVIYPLENERARLGLSEQEMVEFVIQQSVPVGVTPLVIESSELPAHRPFRGSWRISGGAVVNDMPAALNIRKAQIRLERSDILATLDIEWSRAVAGGNQTLADSVEANRQIARDATSHPALAASTTVEELMAADPLLSLRA